MEITTKEVPEESDRKSVVVLEDSNGVYYTALENAFCELMAKESGANQKELNQSATTIYRTLRPNAKLMTAKVNARKLLKQPKILARIEAFKLVTGKTKEAILVEREIITQKALQIANKALDDEISDMDKGYKFDPKGSFLSGGRLMAVNALLTEYQRLYGFADPEGAVSNKTQNNVIFMTPPDKIMAALQEAGKVLKKIDNKGFNGTAGSPNEPPLEAANDL